MGRLTGSRVAAAVLRLEPEGGPGPRESNHGVLAVPPAFALVVVGPPEYVELLGLVPRPVELAPVLEIPRRYVPDLEPVPLPPEDLQRRRLPPSVARVVPGIVRDVRPEDVGLDPKLRTQRLYRVPGQVLDDVEAERGGRDVPVVKLAPQLFGGEALVPGAADVPCLHGVVQVLHDAHVRAAPSLLLVWRDERSPPVPGNPSDLHEIRQEPEMDPFGSRCLLDQGEVFVANKGFRPVFFGSFLGRVDVPLLGELKVFHVIVGVPQAVIIFRPEFRLEPGPCTCQG